ncbi:unnamed protein product [Arctogadus glacialis]
MPFQFCPQCGTKLQADFRFCPSCGEKFPAPAGAGPSGDDTSCGSGESSGSFSPVSVSPRPPLGSPRCADIRGKRPAEDPAPLQDASPVLPKGGRARGKTPAALKQKDGMEGLNAPPAKKAPTPVKGRGRSVCERQVEEKEVSADNFSTSPSPFFKTSPGGDHSPGPKPAQMSPQKESWVVRHNHIRRGSKLKSRSGKRVSAVIPLQEGEELTDKACRKWRLGKLLSQTETDLVYEAFASNSKESKHILKLGAKDGRIFNEQNFLQRAAKASSVDKWIKSNRLDFLGVPPCVGFGLHALQYRFLIFPSMGQTLQSILESKATLPSERTVLQLACRILDVLTFIHSNEYVHGDINAENIYISTEGPSQVFLAGYSHAFRYCPGGQQVEYREASRTPDEGALEYISVDSHKGAGPSRRSDLQSLGYCLLHWLTGTLPWDSTSDPQTICAQKQRFLEDVPTLLSSCFGEKRVSSVVQQYITQVMALGYTDTPDYPALKACLNDGLLAQGGVLEQPLSSMTASCR